MNIIVTGATSFIGYHLINKLILNKENIIYAVVRPDTPKKALINDAKNIHYIELEMSDYYAMNKYIKTADVLFHLAWNGTRNPQRDDETLQKSNFINSTSLCDSLVTSGIRQIILAGSQAEYGNTNGVITEKTESHPTTPYGIYKVKLYEYLMKKYSDCVCIKEPRFFSLYGPGDYENTLIMSCIQKMMKNEEVSLTDCSQIWDYLYVDDACEGLIALMNEKISGGIYNFASGKSKHLKYFVEEIKTMTNTKSLINYGAIKNDKMVSFMPNVDKLKRNTGWFPKVDFTEGIKEIIRLSIY